MGYEEALAEIKRRQREDSQGTFQIGDTVTWEVDLDGNPLIPRGGAITEIRADGKAAVTAYDGRDYVIPLVDCAKIANRF